jgi:aminoglycoside phosphotransferase (APT) family kinase protein
MQRAEIERFCRSFVPGKGVPHVQRIGKGPTSESYRIVRDGAAYALKVAADPPFDPDLDFAWEARVLERAGGARLAPPVVYCDSGLAVMLTRWVAGRSWSPREALLPANIHRIAELLRRVHALAVPSPARVMSPMAWADAYGAALSRRTSHASDPTLRAAAASRWDALAKLPGVAGVVCHSDLHRLNVIEDDESLTLLDWEYAHVSDPLWDLAGWSANNDFEAEAQRQLLMNYFGTPPSLSEWTRFRLLLWLYDYVCLLWSELYLSLRCDGENGISQRATRLDARLHLPAHYAP